MLNIKLFAVNPFRENCYVVSDDTAEAVIIDCGAYHAAERRAVTDYIRSEGLRPLRLVATHAHIDHNCGNGTIFAEFGLRPEVTAADLPLMAALAVQAEALGLPLNGEALPEPGGSLAEDEPIRFGTHSLAVIATPGHSPGSAVLYCAEEAVAFTGDTLFCGSVGRTDLWQGSAALLRRSLARLAGALPADTTLLPGHGPQTTMGDELLQNPFLREAQSANL